MRRSLTLFALVILAGRGRPTARASKTGDSISTGINGRLPTGVRLDPAAPLADVGPMALTIRRAPESGRVVISLSGYAKQGIQVLDATTGAVVQDVTQPAAFVGLAFSPDGQTLYSSGGNQDVVYRYNWANGRATLRDSLVLARKPTARSAGTRYPAGIPADPNGLFVYVAEN